MDESEKQTFGRFYTDPKSNNKKTTVGWNPGENLAGCIGACTSSGSLQCTTELGAVEGQENLTARAPRMEKHAGSEQAASQLHHVQEMTPICSRSITSSIIDGLLPTHSFVL